MIFLLCYLLILYRYRYQATDSFPIQQKGLHSQLFLSSSALHLHATFGTHRFL